jgi:hypothetical protein
LSGKETQLLEQDFSNVDNGKCVFSQNIVYIWIKIWDPSWAALLVRLREGEQGFFSLKIIQAIIHNIIATLCCLLILKVSLA